MFTKNRKELIYQKFHTLSLRRVIFKDKGYQDNILILRFSFPGEAWTVEPSYWIALDMKIISATH